MKNVRHKKKQPSTGNHSSDDLLAVTGDWVWTVDNQFRFTTSNKNSKKILGYRVSELLGKKLFDFMPMTDAKRMRKLFREHSVSKEPFIKITSTQIHKNKSEVIVETTGIPIFADDGNYRGYQCIERDITESVQAKHHARMYKLTVDNHYDGVYWHDINNRIVYVNDAGCKALGYTKRELIGKPLTDLNPRASAKTLNRVWKILRKDGYFSVNSIHHRKDGSVFPVEIITTYHNFEGNEFACGFVRDITERKLAEEQLQEKHHQYQRLVDHARDGIFTLDMNARFRFVNEGICLMLGYTREELLRLSILDTYPEKDRTIGLQRLSQLRIGKSIHFERSMKRKDGNLIMIGAVAWKTEKGYLQAIVRDVTEKRNQELFTQIQLDISKKSVSGTLDDVMQSALDAAESLTESTIGFFHFVDDDQENLTLQAWSTNTVKKMCTAEGKGSHYPISQAGVWAECFHTKKPVIHNNYAGLPHKKGMPEGHAAVIRELVVPILRGDNVVAILGVGNKISEYNQHDVDMVQHLSSVVLDIVERKRTEAQLRASEERFRQIVEQSGEIFYRQNITTGKFEYISPKVFEILGYSPEEWLILDQAEQRNYVHPDDQSTTDNFLKNLIAAEEQGKNHFELEFRLRHKDGDFRWLHGNYSLIRDNSQEPILVVGSLQDITERRRIEDERTVTLAKYKTLFDSFPLGITISDDVGNILESNPAAAKLLGISKDEHHTREIDSPDWMIIRPDGTLMPPDEYASVRALREKRLIENVEMGIVKPNDTVTWINVTAAPLPIDGHGVVITYGDNTDRKKAETELYLKNLVFESSIAANSISDPNGIIHTVNSAFLSMWRYSSKDEVIGRPVSDFLQNQIDVVTIMTALKQNGIWQGEYLARKKDGSTFTAQSVATCLRDMDDKIIGYQSSVMDITERKRILNLIEEQRKIHQIVIDNAHTHLVYLDKDFNFVAVNKTYADGCKKNPNELVGNNHFSIYPNEENESIFKKVRDTGEAVTFHDKPFVYPDQPERGITYWDWTLTPVKGSTGSIEGFVFSLIETTDRKQTEIALQQQKYFTENILNSTDDHLAVVDINGTILEVNDAWKRFAYDNNGGDEIHWGVGANYFNTGDTATDKIARNAHHGIRQVQDGTLPVFDMDYRCDSSQDRRDFNLKVLPLVGKTGTVLVAHREITARKIAEETLQHRTEELSTLLDVSKSLSSTLDLQTILQMTTNRITELTEMKSSAIYILKGELLHLGATAPPLPPQFPEELRTAPIADHPHIQEVLTTRKPVFLHDTSNAKLTPAEQAVVVMRDLRSILYLPLQSGNNSLGVLIVSAVGKPRVLSSQDIELCQTLAHIAAVAIMNATFYVTSQNYAIELEQEISERKHAEKALHLSLTEKEALLREVHHRVKNNLAAITALIEIQRKGLHDTGITTLLSELEGRIRSMAMVHERLYRAENLSRIDFQEYITSLITHLQTSLSTRTGLKTIVECAGIKLGVDTAVPLGLIVNELVTNTIKYAFPQGQPVNGQKDCELKISLSMEGKSCTLRVTDNGIGIPPTVGWTTTQTMGLRLVRMLGEHQLGGQVDLDRSVGTCFIITFEIKETR